MVPGKKYTPEDYLWLAWSHKWLIVFCTSIVAAGTFVWARNLPDRYRAQTLIQVVPQRVPTSFVAPTVTTGIGPRLQMMSQTILSRTQLERLVEELDLYPEERRTLIMEDVILRMRQDISVNVAGNRREPATSFTVAFASESPRTALTVTQRLASLFVSENLENREMLADTTTQFIDTQLDEARRRLIEHEKRLEDYRRRYAGQLPDQVDTNLQMMQGAQARRQSIADEMSRDRDRLAALNEAIAEAMERAASPGGATSAGESADGSTLPVAQQLELARAQVRGLELRLKPEHPDLRRAKRIVAELEAKAEAEALQQPLSPSKPGTAGASSASTAADRLDQMRTEAERLQARLEKLALEQQSVEDALAEYRARLDAIPTRQSELVELMRDYSTLQNTYTTLLGKSEQSKLAVNLERRQVGEQFRIVDNAQLPQRPTSPDRPRLYVMGLLGGLALGLALTALIEYRDTTLKTDSDILVSLSLPVLAVIPAMITREERAKAKRRVVLTGVAGSVAGVAVAVAVVWRLGLLDEWVR